MAQFLCTQRNPRKKEGKEGLSCRPTVPAPEVTQQRRNSSFPGDEEVRESRYVLQWMFLHTVPQKPMEEEILSHTYSLPLQPSCVPYTQSQESPFVYSSAAIRLSYKKEDIRIQQIIGKYFVTSFKIVISPSRVGLGSWHMFLTKTSWSHFTEYDFLWGITGSICTYTAIFYNPYNTVVNSRSPNVACGQGLLAKNCFIVLHSLWLR